MSCMGTYKTVEFEKPSPCHFIKEVKRKDGEVLIILGREEGKLCPQVIVKDKIKVERDVERIKVILDNRIWKEYKLRR